MGIHERKEQSIWAALLKCNEDAGFGEEIVDKREFHLSRAQRMQLKAFVCLLGILLIVILIIGKLSSALCRGDKDNEVQPEPHIPTVRVLKNVWIAEAGEAGLTVFNERQLLSNGESPMGTDRKTQRAMTRGTGSRGQATGSRWRMSH